MSLKQFHIFFIVMSVAFSFGFGTWGLSREGFQLLGVISCAIGAGLVVYGVWFLRKFKQIEKNGQAA